jgi:putative RecB family exonuclease
MRVNDPSGPAAELGTLVHAALEDLYEAPPEARSRVLASKALKVRAKEMTNDGKFADVGDRTAFFREAWTRLLTIWKVEDPASINVIANEQKLHTMVGGVPFSGIIDRLEYVDGVVVVSDYKTGKRDARYREPKDRQIQLYVAATNEATDYKVGGGQIIWLSTTGDVWEVDASAAAVDRTVKYFQNVWEEMAASVKSGQWEERTSMLCGWCPVLSLCESGKRNVKELAAAGRLKSHATAWSIVEVWQ